MNEREKQALGALASMIRQYSEVQPDGMLDSYARSANEHAIGALAAYGYMEEIVEGRIFGKWTKAGEALLAWNYPWSEQGNKPFPEPPIPAK